MSANDIVSFVAKAYQLFYCDEEDDESSSDEELPYYNGQSNNIKSENAQQSLQNNGGSSSWTRQYVMIDNTLARNDGQFRLQFKVNRATVESLCAVLERCLSSSTEAHMGRPSLPVQTQLLVTLWVLVTQESYREVSMRFDVAKSTAIKCVHCICSALLELADTFIKWPTESEAALIADNYQKQSGFPGVIGCIQRIRIPTKVFTEKRHRSDEPTKSVPYVVLQAVCDNEMMFTDCFTSHIGSAQNKDFQQLYKLESALRKCPDDLCYKKYHLLGDESYPLSTSLLTPYNEDTGYTSRSQLRYNSCHSNALSTVDRAFDFLRARFKRLAFIDMNVPQMVRVLVQATCVLHNYCLLHNDRAFEFLNSSGPRSNSTGRKVQRQSSNGEQVPALEIPDWRDDHEAGRAKQTEIECQLPK